MGIINTSAHYHYKIKLLNKTIDKALESAKKHSINFFYAIKANNEKEIVKEIIEQGFGIDCVSKEEISYALKCGVNPNKIAFAGSGKREDEIMYAVMKNIFVMHCESVEEYEIIKKYIKEYKSNTKIALRLNPNVKAGAHKRISTGGKKHKFGMRMEDVVELMRKDPEIIGIHIHIGSQITNYRVFEKFSKKVSNILDSLPRKIHYLNMGGGLGINYNDPNEIPDFERWVKSIRKYLPKERIGIIFLEPGRSIVGQMGKIVGNVLYIKGDNVILDIGMNNNMRPTLYGAKHKITIEKKKIAIRSRGRFKYKIYGPSCESTDVFGTIRLKEELKRGDRVIIHSSGAYCSSMTLNYNMKRKLKSSFDYLNS